MTKKDLTPYVLPFLVCFALLSQCLLAHASPVGPEGLVDPAAPVLVDDGFRYYGNGDMDKAIVSLESMLSRYPDDARVKQTLISALLKKWESLFVKGNFVQSLHYSRRALELEPGSADIAHMNDVIDQVKRIYQVEFPKKTAQKSASVPAKQILKDYAEIKTLCKELQISFLSSQSKVVNLSNTIAEQKRSMEGMTKLCADLSAEQAQNTEKILKMDGVLQLTRQDIERNILWIVGGLFVVLLAIIALVFLRQRRHERQIVLRQEKILSLLYKAEIGEHLEEEKNQ